MTHWLAAGLVITLEMKKMQENDLSVSIGFDDRRESRTRRRNSLCNFGFGEKERKKQLQRRGMSKICFNHFFGQHTGRQENDNDDDPLSN